MKRLREQHNLNKTIFYLVEIEGTAIAFTRSVHGVTYLSEFQLKKEN